MERKLRFAAVILLLISSVLFSCKTTETKDSYIKIEVQEQHTQNGNVIQIPAFVTNNEEIRKNLRSLEREIKNLEKTVEKEQEKGTEMEMRSFVSGTDRYPQVTVIWYIDEDGFRQYNLMTLGADTPEGQPITCKEALLRTDMSGVDLSLKVGKLFHESNIRGELQSTEMQGFEIGESGEVKEIYMKLTLVIEEDGEEEIKEYFFSYIPESEQLVSLSEKGFDLP